MSKYIPNEQLRQILFIALVVLLLVVVLKNLSSFIPGFLGAFCLYVLLARPLTWMTHKKGMNKLLSVLLLMLGSVLVIITPLVVLVNMLSTKISAAIANKMEIQHLIAKGLKRLEEGLGIDLLHLINLRDVTAVLVKIGEGILNTSLSGVIQVAVAYLILYFMLMNRSAMEKWLFTHIPLKRKNLILLDKDLRDLVISNAVGVPIVALVQAVVAYIGYLIFGLDDAFSWFVLTIFAAMVPVVGSAIIYIPACLYLLAIGETTNAYLLLGYCFIVVGVSDNISRFWIQKIIADVHPLITIFGAILGLNLFGFIGIIFGPIVLSLIIWLFRIYNLEFSPQDIDAPDLPPDDSGLHDESKAS